MPDDEKTYCGIGIQLGFPLKVGVPISRVGPGTPADESKLHVGDVLLKSHEPNAPKDDWEPVQYNDNGIRGPAGTAIDLLIRDSTGIVREVDNIIRSGIDAKTLTRNDTLCGIPVSEQPYPGNIPARLGSRVRKVG